MTSLLAPYSVVEVRDAIRVLREGHLTAVAAPIMRAPFALPVDSSSANDELPPVPTGVGSWVVVIAAHPACGASTVALALAEALASGRAVSLVEFAPSTWSGLAGCSTTELGVDGAGCWRRGTRGAVTILRRATDDPAGWPEAQVGGVMVADVGAVGPSDLRTLVGQGPALVVCRASIPGLRAAEQLVPRLPGEHPATVAAVGAKRLARAAVVTLGPRLRQLDSDGRLVGIPDVPSYRVTGPSAAPLPPPIAAAGARLTALMAFAPGDEPARRRARLPRTGRNFE